MAEIPHIIFENLELIEPNSKFRGGPSKVESSSGKIYFTKVGSPKELEQYTGEVESLRAIESAAPGLAPRVLSFGVGGEGGPYFISEYKVLDRITDAAARILAGRLAKELHACKSTQGFGFGVPTYCGLTRLNNGWFESWEKCFSSMIGGLLDQLKERGPYEELWKQGEEIKNRVIPKLLGPLVIQPVLLHGDLWSGNAGVERSTNKPVIFDPSSFYGHNEADLAIARIFGGFSPSFFSTYHAHYPKSEPIEQYALRCDLYELFHYLNHTLLFGGSYMTSAQEKMNKLIEAKLG